MSAAESVLRHIHRQAAASVTDANLLRAYVESRSDDAFRAIVERHGPMVLRTCRRRLGDAHAAEDAFQATFLALARSAKSIRQTEALAGWLFRTAQRFAAKAQSAARRRQRTERRAITRTHDALTELTVPELLNTLDDELGKLADRDRLPLLLVYWQGRSYAQAARELNLTTSAFHGRLERGRQRLAERLRSRGITPGDLGALLAAVLVPAAVPADLLAKTAALAAAGAVIPATVLALASASGGGKVLSVTIAAALIVGVGTIGIAGGWAEPQKAEEKAKPPVAYAPGSPKNEPRVDRFGDKLPEGTLVRFGTGRLRHPGVRAVAFTSSGTVASFGEDMVVRIWDPVTGRQLSSRSLFERDWNKELVIHRSWIGCFSRDAKRLAAQFGNRMRIFDLESSREIGFVELASVYDTMARFSPDARQVALVDQDGKGTCRLRTYDIARNSSREIARVDGFRSEPAFSQDGQRLALATGGAEVVAWDLASGQELIRFKAAGRYAGPVEFDSTGEVLAILGARNPPQWLQFVRISTGKPPDGWTIPSVIGMDWISVAPDGATIVLGGLDAGIRRFDLKTGKTILTTEKAAQARASFSPDGKLTASAGEHAVNVSDALTGRSNVPADIDNAAMGEICGVAVSPSGEWFALREFATGTIRLCDSQGQLKKIIPSNKWRGARDPLFSSDGRQLIGVDSDTVNLVRWDVPSGTQTAQYSFAESVGDQAFIYNFALSADGQRLAALSQPANRAAPANFGGPARKRAAVLTVWDLASSQRMDTREIEFPSLGMYGAFSPDLKRYFSGDRALALAKVPEFRLELPDAWRAKQAAASPDGRLVAQAGEKSITDENGNSIGLEGSVVIQETATGKQIATLPGEWCGPIAFTPDNRGLVTTTGGAITRWNLATRTPSVRHKSPGQFLGSFGHSFASSLAVTRDGAKAITGLKDGTALVWDLPPPPKRASALSEQQLAAAWVEMSGFDASKAYAAIWAVADAADDGVKFLRQRLRPAAAPPEIRVRELVAILDARSFGEREAAEKELGDFGPVAAPELRTLLKSGLSAEQSRRIERLLQAAAAPLLPPGDQLRQVRAVAALELAGTPAARDLLAELAKGAPGARLTEEAKASLARLQAK